MAKIIMALLSEREQEVNTRASEVEMLKNQLIDKITKLILIDQHGGDHLAGVLLDIKQEVTDKLPKHISPFYG